MSPSLFVLCLSRLFTHTLTTLLLMTFENINVILIAMRCHIESIDFQHLLCFSQMTFLYKGHSTALNQHTPTIPIEFYLLLKYRRKYLLMGLFAQIPPQQEHFTIATFDHPEMIGFWSVCILTPNINNLLQKQKHWYHISLRIPFVSVVLWKM